LPLGIKFIRHLWLRRGRMAVGSIDVGICECRETL